MARSLQPYNWLIILGIVALLLGGTTVLQATAVPSVSAQSATDEVPDQHFTTIDGKEISLHQFKGKTVLVHYWGTWCPPCVKELPDLLAAVKDKPNVAVIAVSIEHNKTAITDFLQSVGAVPSDNVYFVMDPSASIVVGQPVNRYPTTVIIGRNMTLVDRINSGINWDGYSF